MSNYTSVLSPTDYPDRKTKAEEPSGSALTAAVAIVSRMLDDSTMEDETLDSKEARRRRGWQDKYVPTVEVAPDFRKFLDLRVELERTVAQLDDYVSGTDVSDDVVAVVTEIEAILADYFELQYGEEESLKQLVMVVLNQIRNAPITIQHCNFLKEVSGLFTTQQLIDETAVDWAMTLVERHGLEEFRGTLTETETLKKYRIIEDTSNAG